MPLRRYPKIPVYVVEDHNDALQWIYRAIGSKHLPFSDNLLIHLDSHPDLLIDPNLQEMDTWNKEALLEGLSIENWILPGCYTGQFSKVCWIKPPWSNQISSGSYKIEIGQFGQNIRIGSDLYYYLSDGLFVDRKKLTNVRQFDLYVSELSPTCIPKCCFEQNLEYILDIDLDYFSTLNPFLTMFEKGGLYQKLKPIFNVMCSSSETRSYRESLDIADKRKLQLEQLKSVFEHLEHHGTLEDLEEDIDQNILSKLEEIIQIVKKNYNEAAFDWSLLLNAGMTCDDTELPHHPSTAEEIDAMLENLAGFLRSLPLPPTLVTIARSSDDDYCPKDSVDEIQNKTLQRLEEVYKDLEVRFVYKEL